MTIQEINNLSVEELEQIFPGPYYIYRVDNYSNKYGFHIGCTRNMKNRKIGHSHNSKSLPVVLFETMSLPEADNKEREIKVEHGMKGVRDNYIFDLRRQLIACRKEVRKKAMKNTDMKAKFNKETRKKMSKCKDNVKRAVKAFTVKHSSPKKIDWSTKKYIGTFESITATGRH